MTLPNISLLEDAANATFWGSITTAFNLTELNGADGKPLQVATANGCTAAAFIDSAGDVIVSFEGTQTTQQQLADVELMSGENGNQIPGFQDAVAFVRTVEQRAASLGIPTSRISVTGHSLGGTLAEYVASQTGLGGASFAGSGVPGYKAPALAAANFTSYVEHGDAFANWSSDGAERTLIAAGVHQDHYGQLVMLGSPSQDALTNTIIADDKALVPAMFTGQLIQALAKLGNDFTANLTTIHGMNVYQGSIAALPTPAVAAAQFSSSPSAMLANFSDPAPLSVGTTSSAMLSAVPPALRHFDEALASLVPALRHFDS